MSSNPYVRDHFYIGGEWVKPSSDRRFTLINASTEEVLGSAPEALERVLGFIEQGKREARLVAGGGKPGSQSRGWFVEPTVFADVSNDATIAREEIFGPVLSIIPYSDESEAVRIANDSIYGLGGSVWSTDGDRARAVAARVKTGTIGINGYVPAIGSPFGGVKASGLGRELGPEALSGYQQYKSTYVMG